MKRLVIMVIIRMCGKAILLTIIAGTVIGVIGYIKKWNTSLAYSNAFFIAGCLAIIGGAFSRLAAGQEWNRFQLLSAESFRDMSSSERANFVVNTSSSVSLLVLGLLSGILLILISVFVTKMFYKETAAPAIRHQAWKAKYCPPKLRAFSSTTTPVQGPVAQPDG